VGVTAQSPPAVRSFGQQDPGAVGQILIAARRGDERGELGHDRELLLPVQRTRVREHLDPDVTAVAVDVAEAFVIELVHERGGVAAEQGDVRNALDGHQCRGEVDSELVPVRERPGTRVHVDHGHGRPSVRFRWSSRRSG